MSTAKRNTKIVAGLRSGDTFRNVAAKVGVHHRTAQRVAILEGAYSARSAEALPEDFNNKGRKAFYKAHPNF